LAGRVAGDRANVSTDKPFFSQMPGSGRQDTTEVENKPKFEPGDVVQLNSGGPKMTVIEVYNNNAYAKCIFYNPDKAYFEEKAFDIKTIKLTD
jgi:uncharacterized protein YodC (DUF2158 family)